MKTFVTKFVLMLVLVLGIGQVASAQCQAAFTTSGSGTSYSFTNNSTPGMGQAFASWDFGDGSFGYNWNENHTYASNGSYVVILTISDSLGGCTSTTYDSVLVTGASGATCSANFSVSGSGTSFSFTNSSTPGASIANANWNFGDGTWGYNWNESHTYSANGTYTVTLSIIDSSSNCTDQISQTVTVTGASGGGNCQAAFTTSGSGTSYNFTNTSSPSNAPYVSWDFGDGSYGSSWNESHTYAANGTYIVALTIGDSLNNCWDTAYDSVVVTGASGGTNCQASFYHFPDSTGQYSIIAVNNSTGSNLTYAWDWGDGSSSTGAYPSHTYAGPGLYLICLTIADANGGCTSVFCDSVNVVNKVAAPFTINVVGSGATGIEEEAVAGLEFYPNPISEKLNIEFDLDRSQNANVLVIDLMGQVVAELHAGILSGGHQSMVWNPENAAPGVYFLTIVTEEGKIAKKVMLAK